MADYSDKEFKEKYQKVLEDIKLLAGHKWDPSVSDESDPGVAILKAFALFYDKLEYKVNYRNSQNSVRNVTDEMEGQDLFFDLGYQIKKKKSAIGEISAKYLGSGGEDDGGAIVDLFTEFTNPSGSIIYTSIRSLTAIPVGQTRLIKVQEGIASRYIYEGNTIFGLEHLTTNLRLPLKGVGEVSGNGVVITTNSETTLGIVADWLNVEDNSFNSVETNNIFSIGRDADGVPYIQFYEESLAGLSNGVGIWVITSSGAAGNITKNKLTKVSSSLTQGDNTAFSITHEEISNGTDAESLSSAMKNYYDSYGINDTLISERDYSVILEKALGPDLIPFISKALVTGVDGPHNLVEILSKTDKGKNIIFTQTLALTSAIFVNALKYSNDYYESFEYLNSPEVENFIKKVLYKKKVVSNNLFLIKEQEPNLSLSTLYDRFVFDSATVVGTIIIDSSDSVDLIKEKVIKVLKEAFNSRNLTAGEMISESALSAAVKSKISGIIEASFYYSEHRLLEKPIDGEILGQTIYGLEADEKRDIVARSILRGDVPLFEKFDLQLIPHSNSAGVSNLSVSPNSTSDSTGDTGNGLDSSGEISDEDKIVSIAGSFTITSGQKNLDKGEFIQFYAPASEEGTVYGYGVKYRLLAKPIELEADRAINTMSLEKGSLIAKNSILPRTSLNTTDHPELLDYLGELEGDPSQIYWKFRESYKVNSVILVETNNVRTMLARGSKIYDGSVINNVKQYAVTIENGEEVNLFNKRAILILQPTNSISSTITLGEKSTDTIKISNFSNGLHSNGSSEDITSIGAEGEFLNAETITQMVPSNLSINSKFYYGLVMDSAKLEGKKLLLDPEDKDHSYYILGEGEHLIYSDENLLDFVDFGSGTLISSNKRIELDNFISLDENFNNNLVNIPSNTILTLTNTLIYTYSDGETIEFPTGCGCESEWTKVLTGAKFTIRNSTDTINTLDDKFYYRTGISIETDENNTMVLKTGQSLTITYGDGETRTLSGIGGATGAYQLISFSESLYQGTATKIYTSKPLRMFSYETTNNQGTGFTGSQISINGQNTSSGFTIGAWLGNDVTETSVAFNTGDRGYLLEINSKFSKEGEISFRSVISRGGASSSLSNKIINLNNPGSTKLVNGLNTLLVRPGGNNLLEFDFRNCKSGDGLEIIKFRQIRGINPNLGFTSESGDESQNYNPEFEYTQNYLDFKPDNEGKALLDEILKLIKGDNNPLYYDFFYTPESQVRNPTNILSYYDPQHIMNRNILTVINMSKAEKNLKIVRRTK